MRGETVEGVEIPPDDAGWTFTCLRYTGKKDAGVFRRLKGPGWNYPVSFFASSSTNLVRGMVNRVLTYKGAPVYPEEKGQPNSDDGDRASCPRAKFWSRLQRRVVDGLRENGLCPTPPMSTDQWLACYRGRKLTMYQKAVDSLKCKALGDRDFEVKAFIKKEKDKIPSMTSWSDPSPDPRIIQPRDPRVTVTFGPFVRSIEGRLYKHFARLWKSIALSTATPVCMKGYNYVQRGDFLCKKWGSFVDPVAVALDCSRFDLHVSTEALGFTDYLYERCFPQKYLPALRYILARRHTTVGVASCKESAWRYSKVGGRCSGDVDTSLGNVCIMLAISVEIADRMRCHIELVNDGDDQIFILEKCDLDALLDVIEPTFWEAGFRVKVEEPVDIFERIDFCQTRPVRNTNGGYTMCRYPQLAMTKDLCSFLPIDRVTVARNMCQAIGDCGWAAYGDMPVLSVFYEKLRKVGGNAESHWRQTGVDLGFFYHVKGLEQFSTAAPAGISPAVRASFWKAFGMPPAEQIALEEEVRGWNVEFGPSGRVVRPSHWWWLGRDHGVASSLRSLI